MFSLDNVLDDLWPQARPAPWQKKLLKKLFYEEEFQQFADRHRHLKGLDTVEQVLEYLNIRCAIPAHDLEQIPEYGPLVIIANHPTGTLDGLALLYAVSRVRRDVKVVTNRMLTHLEPLSSLFIPVDNIHGRTAKTALQQMDQQLQAGGVLIFFPAGEVSRLTRRGIRDKNGTRALLSWRQNIAPRCCQHGLTPTTAPCFTPAPWSPTTCRCSC